MKITREIKIGLVAIGALALFIWGFNFLKGRDLFNSQRTFYAIYTQVDGLTEANPVIINGVKVGRVTNVNFHPNNSGNILVKFVITNDIVIPNVSIARLISSDIMGSKAIEIKWKDSTNILGKKIAYQPIKDGDTLKSDIEVGLVEEVNMQFLPIKKKFETVMLSIDSVLAVIQYIFNEDTRDNLKKSFESIKVTIGNFEHTSMQIDTLVTSQRSRLASIVGNVESISSNIKNNNGKLTHVIENFASISDTLAKVNLVKTINHTNSSLQSFSAIIDKINRGEGSLGMLVNNDSLYMEIKGSSEQLKFLLEDMREHPKRYVHFSVFGKSEKSEKATKKK